MLVNQNQVWAECLSFLSRKVNKQSFFTWLKPTSVLKSNNDNGEFHIGVPNRFVADWLNEHYRLIIGDAFRSVTSRECTFDFVVNPSQQKQQTDMFLVNLAETDRINKPSNPPIKQNGNQTSMPLLDRYHFENFVVGDSNEFAYAASLAVAKSPNRTQHNPLFIYGGVGLGKTHLAQAIGNYIIENDSSARVIYVTSEKFTNEFINSITTRSVSDFTSHYRSADVLIIDDTQFFTGKESTQEQFFHTFNTLHHNNKQIVLTADRPPRDIKGLEKRLLSRFSWGLVTDIQLPSLETRIAILQKKSESEGIPLPVDVLTFIADSVATNIRDLEGSLTRLLAYASLCNKEITVDLAHTVLKDTIPHAKRQITIEQIQKKVADFYNITTELLLSKKKTAQVALARQVAMYLCRTMTDSSLKSIGAEFGGRDHSTVIHAYKTIISMIKRDVNLKLKIDQLINSLYV